MSLRPLSVFLIAVQLLSLVSDVAGQSSSVTCLSNFAWAYNSRQQSPCLVAAYLQGTCNGGQFSVPSLGPGQHYIGPTLNNVTPCQCSTVTFSLMSACGLCQNSSNTIETWSAWQTNCTNIYDRTFPEAIPPGTAVPNWAYLDVIASDNFNAGAAQQSGDTPESTGSAKPTGVVTPTQAGPAPGPTSAPDNAPSPVSKKKSNAGAIAGGVVGGVVLLGLIGGLVAFFLARRRRTSNKAPSSVYGPIKVDVPPTSPPPMSQFSSEYTHNNMSSFPGSQSIIPTSQPRLYDPSDPSTFPSVAPTPTIHTTNSLYTGTGHTPASRGQYTGAPEV